MHKNVQIKKTSFFRRLDDLQFKYGWGNKVNFNVFFINNPDPKLMLKPDPNPKLKLKADPNPDPKIKN